MLANEYIRVERNGEHTNTFKLNPYRYLEQWFGFPFPFSPFPSVCIWEAGSRMCECGGAVFFKVKAVWRQLRDRENVLWSPDDEASSPHLVARQPLGRVEEDFSGSGFFPMWLFFGGGVCFSLFAVYFCDQWLMYCAISVWEKEKKTHDRRCPVKGFNLDFIFVPKWCCLFCFF